MLLTENSFKAQSITLLYIPNFMDCFFFIYFNLKKNVICWKSIPIARNFKGIIVVTTQEMCIIYQFDMPQMHLKLHVPATDTPLDSTFAIHSHVTVCASTL